MVNIIRKQSAATGLFPSQSNNCDVQILIYFHSQFICRWKITTQCLRRLTGYLQSEKELTKILKGLFVHPIKMEGGGFYFMRQNKTFNFWLMYNSIQDLWSSARVTIRFLIPYLTKATFRKSLCSCKLLWFKKRPVYFWDLQYSSLTVFPLSASLDTILPLTHDLGVIKWDLT